MAYSQPVEQASNHMSVELLREPATKHLPSFPGIPGLSTDSTEILAECFRHFFKDEGAVSFAAYSELSWTERQQQISTFLDQRALERRGRRIASIPFNSLFLLTLTHGDISLQNMKLGIDGKVLLIDRGYYGAHLQ